MKMFKKLFALAALVFVLGASAATPLEPSKPLDNVSVTIKSGIISPVKGDWHIRSVSGLELRKNFTPVTGFGIEGAWTINTLNTATAFEHQFVGAFGTCNLMNLFAGYPGQPRLFEIETVVGVGWLHGFLAGPGDYNSWYTKYGLNLNFNVNDQFAISLKPAMVWDMKNGSRTQYNVNKAMFETTAGLTYKFKTSNGTHNFKYSDLRYTQAQYDELMGEVNALRERKPEVKEVVVYREQITQNVVDNTVLNNAVGFMINSSVVQPTELANLANVANFIKINQVPIVLRGYADKDTGTSEYNMALSEARANAVKDVLVSTFGVDPNLLEVISYGSDQQPYSTNDWNRVVTFEIKK